jgi:hypothetical protein
MDSRPRVVSVTTQPIPEGDPAAVFVDDPHSVENARQGSDLNELRPAIPDPLPPTLDQGGCTSGGKLVIKTSDGRTIAYGPSRRPSSIDALWARFSEIVTGGGCEPSCGAEVP